MLYNTDSIDPGKELVGMDELLTWLLVKSESTIYDWLNEDSPRFKNYFPRPFKVGSRLRWYREDICRFIESCALASSNKIDYSKLITPLSTIGVQITEL
jgi:predicted DNA-binding transcriptional regulator AlpA